LLAANCAISSDLVMPGFLPKRFLSGTRSHWSALESHLMGQIHKAARYA